MRQLGFIALTGLLGACAKPPDRGSLFIETAMESGLDFWHFSGATGNFLMQEIVYSGVAILDYDGDGDLDVFFLQGPALEAESLQDALRQPPAGWQPGNRLFRNELIPQGRLAFIDVSDEAGEIGAGYGMSTVVGDYDNDGDPDIYVSGSADSYLLRNDNGRFIDVTEASGIVDPRWNVNGVFADIDLDGDLDLFVSSYLAIAEPNDLVCRNRADYQDYCSPNAFEGLADRLWRNDGNGHFVDISDQSGIGATTGAGLGVVAADFNSDGWLDVFVANDGAPNHLWLNRGDSTFSESGLVSGVAYNGSGAAEASMGVTAADFDLDGDIDLFMTHLGTETNTLYQNDGSGNYYDITARTDLGAASLRNTGWGTNWFDADNDGDLDLFIANGAIMAGVSDSDHHPYAQKNQVFLATDNGRYVELPGVDIAPQNSRGAAFGDIDNDGDIDVVVANNDGPAQLYLNQTDSTRHWVQLQLTGQKSNRDAAGARVALLQQTPRWRRVARDGSYAAANDPRVHFGLDDDNTNVDIGVIWPDGSRELWRNLPVDQISRLIEGAGESWH